MYNVDFFKAELHFMQLSLAVGLGIEGGYALKDLLGKKCGAKLRMEDDFIRASWFVNPEEITNIEWLNGAVDDLPF